MQNPDNKADSSRDIINDAASSDYKYGFVSDVDTDVLPCGLDEGVVREISRRKGEPEWLLDFRLQAFRYWQTLEMPRWAHLDIPEIDFQAISYYAEPRKKEGPKSLDEVDPQMLDTFNRLGIPLEEQKQLSGMAVDAVFDSVSVATTHREKLAQLGIIFCPISEAVREYPDLVRKYLGSVVSYRDNFFAAAQLGGVFRRLVCVHPQGCALPPWSCRPTSASTRPARASLSARSSWPTTTPM